MSIVRESENAALKSPASFDDFLAYFPHTEVLSTIESLLVVVGEGLGLVDRCGRCGDGRHEFFWALEDGVGSVVVVVVDFVAAIVVAAVFVVAGCYRGRRWRSRCWCPACCQALWLCRCCDWRSCGLSCWPACC